MMIHVFILPSILRLVPVRAASSYGCRTRIALITRHLPRFDDNPGRILFRLDRPAKPRLLVLSPHEPDWPRAFRDFSEVLAGEPRFKPFEPVLSAGQVLRFFLRANPTVKREGHRHGLSREEAKSSGSARVRPVVSPRRT